MDGQGCWANILNDIGYAILSKLPEVIDHVLFSAVCKNWNSIVEEYNTLTRPTHGTLPMLLVPASDCYDTQTRRLYSVSAGQLFPKILIPNIPNKRCCGSSYGWLAFVEEDLSVTLINPFKFRGTIVRLPVLKSKPVFPYEETVIKLITSPESTPDNYTVVAIYDGTADLATIKSGESDWTRVAVDHITKYGVGFCDIVFHKGLLYTTCYSFSVMSVNIDARPPRLRLLKEKEPFNPYNLHEKWLANYIVESTSGDLFVLRRRVENVFITKVFNVFKLKINEESGELLSVVETKSLDGDAVFIGDNCSAAVGALKLGCCEADSIYFLDDFYISDGRSDNEVEDSGIFKMKDKSLGRHYVRHLEHRYRPPAIWVQLPFKSCSEVSSTIADC